MINYFRIVFPGLQALITKESLQVDFFIFLRSKEKAQQLEKQLREHELQKEYVCKVLGEFPRFV